MNSPKKNKIISKQELSSILKKITPSFDYKEQIKFYSLWSAFIDKHANQSIHFSNLLPSEEWNECFPLEYILEEIEITILFDIERLLKYIRQGNLICSSMKSSLIKTDFHYTDMGDCSPVSKTVYPVIVYFPMLSDNTLKHFVVIDGNHRVTNSISKDDDFYVLYISPFNLGLPFFKNLNSWIAYQLIASYHQIIESDKSKRELLYSQLSLMLENILTKK